MSLTVIRTPFACAIGRQFLSNNCWPSPHQARDSTNRREFQRACNSTSLGCDLLSFGMERERLQENNEM